jgi:CRP/FNR family cyclic AMP-dependent transcriptional regulator
MRPVNPFPKVCAGATWASVAKVTLSNKLSGWNAGGTGRMRSTRSMTDHVGIQPSHPRGCRTAISDWGPPTDLATARAAADREWHTWKVPSDGFSRQRVEPSGGSDPFANSKILASLNADDRLQLVDRCIQRRYEKGQIVYCQGEPSESMLILRTGCLKISSFSSEGDELVFSKVLPGEIIGELGILSNVPRSATVTALQLSSALTLRRSVVMELIEERPAVAVAMLQQLADKVRRTTGAAADIVFLDLAQRVAKFLLQEAAQPSNEIRTTQAELALGVGASRQRVNSCLQEFQRDEWISLAPRSIRLRNPDALRRLMGM